MFGSDVSARNLSWFRECKSDRGKKNKIKKWQSEGGVGLHGVCLCVCVGGGRYVFFACTITIFSHIFCFISFIRAPVHVFSYLLDGFRDWKNCSSLEHIFLAGSYATHQWCVSLSVHVWTCQVTDRHHPYLMDVYLSYLFVCFHVR